MFKRKRDNMKNVLVVNRLEKEALAQLKQHANVNVFIGDATLSNPAFVEALGEAEGITGLGLPVNKALLEKAPHLKIVSNVSVGHNNLDLEAMTEKGIMGTNTPGVLNETVADLVFGLLLATARRLPELDQYVKTGQWQGDLHADYYGIDVHQKKLGIIGMGRIGEAIAKRAHFGFDMDILYHNRRQKPEIETRFKAQYCSKDELLEQADFVLLMTPLTKETEGFLKKEDFLKMKASAIFINGSRGKTIVEADLIDVLKTGKIRAAGLDVFATEPVEKDNPLLSMPHVVTLPHIGSSTYQTELDMSVLAVENLLAGLNGQKPKNLLNDDVWDR